MKKVSVIIPTYNRFDLLLQAIDSVKQQTYENIEIIVVNDRSTDPEYYSYDYPGVNILHLSDGSMRRHGKIVPGAHPRNQGMKLATGDYVAFLDDDDIWMPWKVQEQVKAMTQHAWYMSCTDGYIGEGTYNPLLQYKKYNAEYYHKDLVNIYASKGSSDLFPVKETETGFPKIWNSRFLGVHNCCITSSVMVHRAVIQQVGLFKIMDYFEDYDYWKRVLQLTQCVYVDKPCFYYNLTPCHHYDKQ